MKNAIQFSTKEKKHELPNTWEKLNRELYIDLFRDLTKMAVGVLSPGMVRVNFVCNALGINPKKLKSDDAFRNIAYLSEQVTFMFSIQYPDQDSALSDLPPDVRSQAKKTAPHLMDPSPIAKYLQRLPYTFVVDDCFCAQLIPSVRIGLHRYKGYSVNTDFNSLTCSLTALQYIEACRLIGGSQNQLPLLASILYHPGTYSSSSAHRMAHIFTALPPEVLQAIAFNFRSFNNYLLHRTPFAILSQGTIEQKSSISTGAIESLYNLSNDGLGDVQTIEQMNIIQYLTILRKKTIEAVRSMSEAKMDITEIEKTTGLPIHIIRQII